MSEPTRLKAIGLGSTIGSLGTLAGVKLGAEFASHAFPNPLTYQEIFSSMGSMLTGGVLGLIVASLLFESSRRYFLIYAVAASAISAPIVLTLPVTFRLPTF